MRSQRNAETGRFEGEGSTRRELMSLFAGVESRRKKRWLAAFLCTGEIKETARIAGLSWPSHYNWLRDDPAYAQAFEVAKRITRDSAEDEVHRRAFHGFAKPVIYKGEITGTYLEYSDTLAQFWLKGNCPEKYRDSLIGLTSNAPAGISIVLIGGQAEPPASKQLTDESDAASFRNDVNVDKPKASDAS